MSDLPQCKCNIKPYRIITENGLIYIAQKVRHHGRWEILKTPLDEHIANIKKEAEKLAS